MTRYRLPNIPYAGGKTIYKIGKERQRRGRATWLAATAITVLAGVAVPYGMLTESAMIMAVPLFWLLFGVVVIILIVIGVMRWSDEA